MSADLTVPVVAWEYESEDPYDAGELMLSHVKPERRKVQPLVRQRDHEAVIASLSARLEAAERAWCEVCDEAPAGIDSDGRKFILLSEERCIRVGSAIAGEAKG